MGICIFFHFGGYSQQATASEQGDKKKHEEEEAEEQEKEEEQGTQTLALAVFFAPLLPSLHTRLAPTQLGPRCPAHRLQAQSL